MLGWECFPTRGHASHHVSYFRDGTLLAGDAAGVRMPGSRYVLPVSPPPDIDVEEWHETAAAIRARATRAPRADPLRRPRGRRRRTSTGSRAELDRWAERVRDGMDQEAFVEAALADAGDDAEAYDRVAPFWQSWQGLKRYWETRA